jgi:hypothetical protein
MHPASMSLKTYFQGSRLARMSDGTYCVIRDLGLVKGGRGLKHHENLLSLSLEGIASKLVRFLRRQFLQRQAERLQYRGRPDDAPEVARVRVAGSPKGKRADGPRLARQHRLGLE